MASTTNMSTPTELSTLQQENENLKQENEKLKKENKKLELYDRLIQQMEDMYSEAKNKKNQDQKDWIDSNWNSILDGMTDHGACMITGWNAGEESDEDSKEGEESEEEGEEEEDSEEGEESEEEEESEAEAAYLKAKGEADDCFNSGVQSGWTDEQKEDYKKIQGRIEDIFYLIKRGYVTKEEVMGHIQKNLAEEES